MKLTVLGAGAIGSMLGGLIKHYAPQWDVLLIARGTHGREMRQKGGVTVKGGWGEFQVPLRVSFDPRDVAGSEVVLVTVKSHATAEAMRLAADQMGEATVISIQNGINQPVLSQWVRPDRLVMGMTATKVAVDVPGSAVMQRNDVTVLGPSSADTPEDVVRAAMKTIGRSRLKTAYDPQILGAQYNKLVFNTLGAAASLSDSDFLGEAVLHRPWRDAVAIPLQQESLSVLARAGIGLSRVPGASDAQRFGRLLRMLNRPGLGRVTELVVRTFFNRRSIRFSLGTDLHCGKRTEVDFINGEFVRLADRHGARAPLNAKVVELVHQLEHQGGFLTREEVIAQFRNLMS